MPEGRFLNKTVAHDLELNSVSLEADYLFLRCIPHLDAEGRIRGHPVEVKGIAVPVRGEMTPDVVENCLYELHEAGLVTWYEVDGKLCLEFPGFKANQKGLRKDREAESRIPSPKTKAAQAVTGSLRTNSGPTPDEVRTNSGVTPEDSGQSEVKLREVKGSKEGYLPASTPPDPGENLEAVFHNRHEWEKRTLEVVQRHWYHGEEEVTVNGHTVGLGLARTQIRRWRKHIDREEIHGAVRMAPRAWEGPDPWTAEPRTLALMELGGRPGGPLWERSLGLWHKALSRDSPATVPDTEDGLF